MALADVRILPALALVLASAACETRHPAPPRAEPPRTAASALPVASALPSAPAPVVAPPAPAAPKLDRAAYPWLDDKSLSPPEVADTLAARFPTPAGYTRVSLDSASFGHWLQNIPLAPPGTPVRAYDGQELHPANDSRIAAVIALDVSKADLQQCADTVIRLDAEWRWSQGRRDMSYRAASGTPLPFERWARGERIVPKGQDIQWAPGGGKPSTEHASFRKYLDSVFAWANTVSLQRQAQLVKAEDARPGDFFIFPGNPGHAVLILDMATKGDARIALLGQSYMPAQNAQVLAHQGNPWFSLDPKVDVDTPFWKPFPWSTLHRLAP